MPEGLELSRASPYRRSLNFVCALVGINALRMQHSSTFDPATAHHHHVPVEKDVFPMMICTDFSRKAPANITSIIRQPWRVVQIPILVFLQCLLLALYLFKEKYSVSRLFLKGYVSQIQS